MARKFRNRWLCLMGCALLCFHQAGCVTLSSLMGRGRTGKLDTSYLEAAGYSIPPGGMPTPVGRTSGDGQSIIMEVRGEGEKPHLEQIPLSRERPMFVEDLVRDAKINERLGGVAISIMRPAGPNLPPVRMDVRVKDDGKVKEMEENYALMPGDHLIITYDQKTSLEMLFDTFKR